MKKTAVLAIFLFLIPAWSLAEDKAGEGDKKKPETSRHDIHPQPKEYFVDVLLPHLWEGTKASFADETVPYWTLSVMSAAGAFTQDDKVRSWFLEEEPLKGWENVGNFWGEGYTQAGVALAFWGTGWLWKDQKLAGTGEVLMEAEILNGIFTTAFKSIVGRERPDKSSHDSFPSGHASDSFCFAAVIDDRLGHGYGAAAYALALLTGMSRMESDRHYFSDVVMGAGMGMIIGYSVSQRHDDWPYEKRWHRTEKKTSLQKVYFMPVNPPSGAEGIGIQAYIPLD
jgi:hypothetical protein